MALIGLLCEDGESRRLLTLAVEESGHRVAWAANLADALEVVREDNPHLMVVEGGTRERSAESFLAQVEAAAPLMPVIVALVQRDAVRAVELMKAGAAEVVAPPWTRENLSACIAKALRFRGTSFELVRPVESVRHWIFYAFAVAAFLSMVLGYAALARRQKASEEARRAPAPVEWELPYAHPAGMAWRSGELWVADWYAQAVYRHDPATLAVRRTIPLPTETPSAVAMAGDALFIVSQSGQIVKHMLDEKLTVLVRYAEALPSTVGMAYDGLYLWTLDVRERKLRKHLLDSQLTVLDVYDYPGTKPAALACDGRHLWSIDGANRELLQHDMEDPRQVTYKLPLLAYQSGTWRPTGLAWDGVRFWSVAEHAGGLEKQGRIFQHQVSESALPERR